LQARFILFEETQYYEFAFLNQLITPNCKQPLVPTLTAGKTIAIDNASFHQSQKIKDLIKNVGCELIYLPPYSPDLNPIEHYWHKIKTVVRKKMRDIKIALEDAMCSALAEMSSC
jgi:transposase